MDENGLCSARSAGFCHGCSKHRSTTSPTKSTIFTLLCLQFHLLLISFERLPLEQVTIRCNPRISQVDSSSHCLLMRCSSFRISQKGGFLHLSVTVLAVLLGPKRKFRSTMESQDNTTIRPCKKPEAFAQDDSQTNDQDSKVT